MNAPLIGLAQVGTELLSLEKVYDRDMGFIIPSYQRPYVWSDEDVIKLFDDIKDAYSAQEPQYFIGSVLSAVRTSGHVYELIDGQQRTTTLMLFSLAFRSIGVHTPLANVAVFREAPRLTFEIRESVHNLLGSYAGLEKVSKPGPDAIRNDPYLTHLDANLTVLRQQLTTLGTNKEFDLVAFAEYIYKKVRWVNNIVPEGMDLNRMFSNMNTAGIQLEPVDLLKAKLFKKIHTKKSVYSAIWQACEHTDRYFESNLRQVFPSADWSSVQYKDLKKPIAELFANKADLSPGERYGKTLAQLLETGDQENDCEAPQPTTPANKKTEIPDDTVYCRSIIGFELLLIHTLRIFCAQQGWPDLAPRIKAGNLMSCFECLLKGDELVIKEFIELLWQVRYQFDTWVVKWVEDGDQGDAQLRLTTISPSQPGNHFYRTAREVSEVVQLQAVRNFTGDRSAQYWLTALLGRLVSAPDMNEAGVLATLEALDNQMSLTTETQKEASFKIVKGELPAAISWQEQASYFDQARGTAFEHYWFQKLEYLLWKRGNKDVDAKLRRYRIASKNSVEHVHPQNEEYENHLPKGDLDAFGNLVLLSPGENSSYSNQTVLKKKADFESKPRYDSLKLKEIFEQHSQSGGTWDTVQIHQHQERMLCILANHYENPVAAANILPQ